MALKIYLITDRRADYDELESAVVIANDEHEAVKIAIRETEHQAGDPGAAAGSWPQFRRYTDLQIREIPMVAGAVLGYARSV